MKKLIIINGTMGVGKSTVCRLLLEKLKPSVFLDGDWCWNMNPFVVTLENKNMVIDNITHLLKNFLHNTGYQYIIFCWVIHQEDIFEQLLTPLISCNFELTKISLVCSEAALKERLETDIQKGIRTADIIEKSIPRLALYTEMDTIKIDVSKLSPLKTADRICHLVAK